MGSDSGMTRHTDIDFTPKGARDASHVGLA